MFKFIFHNDVLTGATFWLVIALGVFAYSTLPREQDPSINFNWVQIITMWPGASAVDMEKKVTDPLEEGIAKVSDIKFISSSSRAGASNILVRFNDLDDDQFYRRMSDLRREIQNQQDQLPDDIAEPEIFEITSASAFPTATLLVVGWANDDILYRFARIAQDDLERWSEVDRVHSFGDADPEILVHFSLERLAGLGVTPADIADTVKSYFQDLAAGSIDLGDEEWLVSLSGTSSDPDYLGRLPMITTEGEVPLRSVADISLGTEDPQELVYFNNRPAILLTVFKKAKANSLELLTQIREYIAERNATNRATGIEMLLVDDQTVATRDAIRVMQNNALIGLVLVMLVTWIFLGGKIALFTTVGIPFVLAGTLFVLSLLGQTLNVSVLLGIVISLGMLVDDAVVVVEAIYFHLQRGMAGLDAAVQALKEAMPPVTTAVMTTIAAFLPLMLMPGILGDFMRVVPIVVTVALLISLVEAYWMLPAHIVRSRVRLDNFSPMQNLRSRGTHWLRTSYTRLLVKVFRRPQRSLAIFGAIGIVAVVLLVSGLVRLDFFASDLFRLFYINVTMPAGTSLEKTSQTLREVEKVVRRELHPNEVRAVTSYAGLGSTEKEPLLGNELGQIFVSLRPVSEGGRTVDEIVDGMRAAVSGVPGPVQTSFLRRKTGPPASKPINIKVRGDSFERIGQAADALVSELKQIRGIKDVSDDDALGKMVLSIRLNPDAVTRAGLNPADVIRIVRLFTDGEIVAEMQHEGEKLEVRVRANPEAFDDIDAFLANSVALPDGGEISLEELLFFETDRARNSVRHYNLRRAITIEGDIDPGVIDTVQANALIQRVWGKYASSFPDVDIDLTGELDDIQESINAMAMLFMVGLGLIFLILGTLFRSYIQPLIVLTAVPMAFVGVVLGLFITQNPLSLYTLYGVIALAGIAANDAIVLISTANRHLRGGFSRIHAIAYAARRRVIPILITSLTTIAGLFSLATGLGGKSLLWAPVATSIVWGLTFSTVLTLFVVPLLYFRLVRVPERAEGRFALPPLTEPVPNFVGTVRKILGLRSGPTQATRGQFRDLAMIRNDPENWALYTQGTRALQEQDIETAMRNFQKLADAFPQVALFNLYAAQSHVEFMRRFGWDIGYMARAKRYLLRAKRINPRDKLVAQLEGAVAALEGEAD